MKFDFFQSLKIMEILEQYQKEYTLDNKSIPIFTIEENVGNYLLFNDVQYNIVKYLGKIQGLLNKNLRKLWLRNDGISIDYKSLESQIDREYFENNTTELHLEFDGKINFQIVSKIKRLEKIFIKKVNELRLGQDIFISDLSKLFSDRKKYPEFNILIDHRSYYFGLDFKYYNEEQKLKTYLDKLSSLCIDVDRVFTYANVDHGIVCTSCRQYQKYYYLYLKIGNLSTISYQKLDSLFPILAKNKDLVKKIKVLVVNDINILNHISNVYEPAYRSIGIILEIAIIGTLYRTLK